jgi:hypothetical protein
VESISETIPTKYKQVTVDVPDERVAEFHAFFALFLAGRGRRGRRGEYSRHAYRRRHGCAHRHERAQQGEAHEGATEAPGQTAETTEV